MRRILSCATGVALFAAGCSTAPPPDDTVQPPAIGAELPRPEPAAPPDSAVTVDGPLTLGAALRLALLHNPDLGVGAWESRIREAEAIEAGLRPNPELGIEVENFGGANELRGFRGAETTLALSQLVRIGGDRARQLEVARLDRDVAAWDYEVRRIEVLARTQQHFVALLAAQEQLALADELTDVARRLLESVRRRVRAGATSEVEEQRAAVALETMLVERRRAERALVIARSELAAQWGGDDPSVGEAWGDLHRIAPVPDREQLERAIESTPSLARWSAELARREADIARVRAGRAPDLSVGAGLRHFAETGDFAAIVGMSLPLPFFDRDQGEIAAAEARRMQAEHARRARRVDLVRALRAALEAAASSHDEALALEQRAIPGAESAFALAEEAWGRGRMSLTDVLDTERTLFELRGLLVDALRRHHTAVAELERLSGVPLLALPRDPEVPE